MATGGLIDDRKKKKWAASRLQTAAWSFYGSSQDLEDYRAEGGIRYAVGWLSDQMSRMLWRVTFDDSLDWEVTTATGVTIRSNSTQQDPTKPDHPLRASEELLNQITWGPSKVRQITTNLFVAGECHYAMVGDEWTVVAVTRPDRADVLESARLLVRGLWPHPENPAKPDAPIFGVLGDLEQLWWLDRQATAQSRSRIRAGQHIIGVSDQFMIELPGGETSESFYDDFMAALTVPMRSPDDAAPLIVRGPADQIAPSGSNMAGLAIVTPDAPYDEQLDERIAKRIERLAQGLPLPKEILLGMQAQSRATAFQVEQSGYRDHVEPPAQLVAWVAKQALDLLLADDERLIEVRPDPSKILARPHTTADALNLYREELVSAAYVREVFGVPESAAPSDEELAERRARASGSSVVDPAEEPGVVAAVGGPNDPGLTGPELEALSEALASIDAALSSELVGATREATVAARKALGARVFSSSELRERLPKDTDRVDAAGVIGLEALDALGVPVDTVILTALDEFLGWWETRVLSAYEQVEGLLGDEINTGLGPVRAVASRIMLANQMVAHVRATITSRTMLPLSARTCQDVLTAAGDQIA